MGQEVSKDILDFKDVQVLADWKDQKDKKVVMDLWDVLEMKDIKVMKDDPAGVEAMSDEIKQKYSKIFKV